MKNMPKEVSIRHLDPDSPEGKALAEDIERTIAEAKEWAKRRGATSMEGLLITGDGPKSIDEVD
jgi:hypothetical protein